MENISEYQKIRGSNLGRNWQILAELGVKLPNPKGQIVLQKVNRRTKVSAKKSVKRLNKDSATSQNTSRFELRVRLRSRGPDHEEVQEEMYGQGSESDEDSQEEYEMKHPPREPKYRIPRPNTYGKVEGIKVGDWWRTRMECSTDGVHRPTVAGIHGGPDGAYSVAISGGYEDDVDLGDSFTYTGEGGRDLKGTVNKPKNLRTAPQSKDQLLVKGNLALSRSAATGNPVRVIRGYKLDNMYAPVEGYRYDGLYQVKKYWEAVGKAGFKVYKFAFVRCDDEPAPWAPEDSKAEDSVKDHAEAPESCQEIERESMTCEKSKKDQIQNRKIMLFNSGIGVKSPVKVPEDAEDILPCVVKLTDFQMKMTPTKSTQEMKSFSISPSEADWLGWEKVESIEGGCLIVECDSVRTKVRLEKETWRDLQWNIANSPLSTSLDVDSPGPLDWLGWP